MRKPNYISVTRAAELLGICRRHVYNLLKKAGWRVVPAHLVKKNGQPVSKVDLNQLRKEMRQ